MAPLTLLVFSMVAVGATLAQRLDPEFGVIGCENVRCPRGTVCIERRACRHCVPRPACVDTRNSVGRCPRGGLVPRCRGLCSRRGDCMAGLICCDGCCVRPRIGGGPGRCPRDRCFSDRECPLGTTCCGSCPRKCA